MPADNLSAIYEAVGKKEELMFAYPAVICFSVYFFIVEVNTLLNAYKDAAGIWHEDRFRPLVTAIVNLCLNLIMVQFWGIYGIFAFNSIIYAACRNALAFKEPVQYNFLKNRCLDSI